MSITLSVGLNCGFDSQPAKRAASSISVSGFMIDKG